MKSLYRGCGFTLDDVAHLLQPLDVFSNVFGHWWKDTTIVLVR